MHSKFNKRPAVTAIIGFASQGVIIVASDSQMSYATDSFKQPGTKKFANIKFGDRWAVLAKAGSIDVGNMFQEAFEAKALKQPMTSARTPADIAEAALKEVRNKILSSYYHETFDPGASERHLQSHASSFMLAYYFGNTPFIYTLSLESGTAVRSNHTFQAIGCAANLASFVLSGIDLIKLRVDKAMGIAVYAIEMCKRHDSFCGGRTQLGLITDGPLKPFFLKPEIMDTFSKASAATEIEMQDVLAKLVTKNFSHLRAIEQQTDSK